MERDNELYNNDINDNEVNKLIKTLECAVMQSIGIIFNDKEHAESFILSKRVKSYYEQCYRIALMIEDNGSYKQEIRKEGEKIRKSNDLITPFSKAMDIFHSYNNTYNYRGLSDVMKRLVYTLIKKDKNYNGCYMELNKMLKAYKAKLYEENSTNVSVSNH